MIIIQAKSYGLSEYTPDVFTAMLRDKPVSARMSVRELSKALTETERLEFMAIVLEDLKKNCVLAA